MEWACLLLLVLAVLAWTVMQTLYAPAVAAVEALTPAATGNIGGMGLPVILSWPAAAALAGIAAWVVAKISLGLRSDYLAIATLGISQIIIAIMMNEDWLDRGVKNIINIGRWPVPHEVALQQSDWFIALAQFFQADIRVASSIFVGTCFVVLFSVVLLLVVLMSERLLNSPWGRMMRAIRDNPVAAEAMGKDVKKRQLHIFVLGSSIIGIAGALYVMRHGLLSPGSYNDALHVPDLGDDDHRRIRKQSRRDSRRLHRDAALGPGGKSWSNARPVPGSHDAGGTGQAADHRLGRADAPSAGRYRSAGCVALCAKRPDPREAQCQGLTLAGKTILVAVAPARPTSRHSETRLVNRSHHRA